MFLAEFGDEPRRHLVRGRGRKGSKHLLFFVGEMVEDFLVEDERDGLDGLFGIRSRLLGKQFPHIFDKLGKELGGPRSRAAGSRVETTWHSYSTDKRPRR